MATRAKKPGAEEMGRRLRAAREALGIGQKTAAYMLGIHVNSYTQYEHGKCSPSLNQLMRFVRVLGLDMGIIFPEAKGHDSGGKRQGEGKAPFREPIGVRLRRPIRQRLGWEPVGGPVPGGDEVVGGG